MAHPAARKADAVLAGVACSALLFAALFYIDGAANLEHPLLITFVGITMFGAGTSFTAAISRKGHYITPKPGFTPMEVYLTSAAISSAPFITFVAIFMAVN